jgi:hypothetical protein
MPYIQDHWEIDEAGNIWDKTGDEPEWKGFKKPDGTVYTEMGEWINPDTGEVDDPSSSEGGDSITVKGPEKKTTKFDDDADVDDLFSGGAGWGYGAGKKDTQKSHSSSVGGAMADKYTPKPKPKWGGYGGYDNYGGGYSKYGGYKGGTGYGGKTAYEKKDYSSPSPTSTTTHGMNARKINIEKLTKLTDNIWMENCDTFADASEDDVARVAELLSKDIGELFDASGLVWGSDAGVELRNFMKKWLTENVKISDSR